MNLPLVVQDLLVRLTSKFGACETFGRSRLFKIGTSFSCSINYSKLLGGHRFFFGVSSEIVDRAFTFPATKFGDFVVLVCADPDHALVLPRSLVVEMLTNVPTRRIDVFLEDGCYVLQTTKHPKLDVTGFINAFPKSVAANSRDAEEAASTSADRVHSRIQWTLIRLGRAEGCSIWVPPNDRNLTFNRESFAAHTVERLPNFGFDENTRRIVQNIDVLWLTQNVISKAFVWRQLVFPLNDNYKYHWIDAGWNVRRA